MSANLQKLLVKSPDDVVITLAVRSPLTKAKKAGGFAETAPEEMMLEFFKGVIAKSNIDPALVEDIVMGNTLETAMAYKGRAAALAAGYPNTSSFQTINRFCSSGLMAVSIVANQIALGQIECGLAVGFESMSATSDRGSPTFSKDLNASAEAMDVLQPMGWTSENVSRDFGITRLRMDELALASNLRAANAQDKGFFDKEIMPMYAYQTVAGSSERQRVLVAKDNGPRAASTAEGLAKVRPAFGGTTTGGNASQLTDGIAGVLLMKRSKANELGLQILGRSVTCVTAGLAPRIMGIGPSVAIPKLLKQVGLAKEEIDLFEVNEAFASMFGYMIDVFSLPHEKVNVNGGAIALGHPLGCTGARQVATGLHELRRRGGKTLVTSMCIGSGMGAASLFIAEYA